MERNKALKEILKFYKTVKIKKHKTDIMKAYNVNLEFIHIGIRTIKLYIGDEVIVKPRNYINFKELLDSRDEQYHSLCNSNTGYRHSSLVFRRGVVHISYMYDKKYYVENLKKGYRVALKTVYTKLSHLTKVPCPVVFDLTEGYKELAKTVDTETMVKLLSLDYPGTELSNDIKFAVNNFNLYADRCGTVIILDSLHRACFVSIINGTLHKGICNNYTMSNGVIKFGSSRYKLVREELIQRAVTVNNSLVIDLPEYYFKHKG